MPKLKLAVIFGGTSSEHAISCLSAYSVLTNLDSEKYSVLMLGITKGGRFLLFEGSPEDIKTGRWEFDNCTPAVISPDRKTRGLLLEDGSSVRLDLAFPVLHGLFGEDGTIQGLLSLANIPYVGCGVASSAICMDKITAKALFSQAGLPQCGYRAFSINDLITDRSALLADIVDRLGFPVFVKPSRAGSSIGVSKAADLPSLEAAISEASLQDSRILVEEAVNAREIEVAVIGNENPSASRCGEILPAADFYSYDAKYNDANSGLSIPADIPPEVEEEIRSTAVKAYKAADCRGLARVDFFICKNSGRIFLNEINTMPGFTDISMYPKLQMFEGRSYGELLDDLCSLALDSGVSA